MCVSLSFSPSPSPSLSHTCLYIYIHVLESRKDVERSPLTDPCMCTSLIAP